MNLNVLIGFALPLNFCWVGSGIAEHAVNRAREPGAVKSDIHAFTNAKKSLKNAREVLLKQDRTVQQEAENTAKAWAEKETAKEETFKMVCVEQVEIWNAKRTNVKSREYFQFDAKVKVAKNKDGEIKVSLVTSSDAYPPDYDFFPGLSIKDPGRSGNSVSWICKSPEADGGGTFEIHDFGMGQTQLIMKRLVFQTGNKDESSRENLVYCRTVPQ